MPSCVSSTMSEAGEDSPLIPVTVLVTAPINPEIENPFPTQQTFPPQNPTTKKHHLPIPCNDQTTITQDM